MSEQLMTTDLGGAVDGRWRVSYSPGDWLVLSGESSLVVLQPASGQWSDLVNSIWDSISVAETEEDLTSRLESFGLDQMPSLAWFFWTEGEMRSVIRGELRVVDHDRGTLIECGSEPTSWSVGDLAQVQRLRVEMQPYDGPLPVLELPLVSGGVTSSSIVLNRIGPVTATPTAGVPEEPVAEAPEARRDVEFTVPVEAPPAEPMPEPFFSQPTEAADAPVVFAVFCPLQHPNPPEARTCRLCYGPIAPQQPQQIPRPVLAVLLPSSSGPVDIDRPVLIGRSPSTSRAESDQLPWLLTVPSPSHDISRTHLEVAPYGWQLRATDLNSTNGTILIRPNAAPVRMPPGQSVEVTPGCVFDLGDGITIAIDNAQG